MRKLAPTLFFFVFIVTIGALVAAAQTKTPDKPAAASSRHTMVTPDQVKWGPGPPALPPGAQAAVLEGDPAKPGLFTIRVKFPDGYTVPPHWHPTAEYVTVLSGTLMAALGDKLDTSAMHALPSGGFVTMPRRTNHYVRAKGDTTLQITSTGPFEVTYVNPGDDPRKKTTATK